MEAGGGARARARRDGSLIVTRQLCWCSHASGRLNLVFAREQSLVSSEDPDFLPGSQLIMLGNLIKYHKFSGLLSLLKANHL